MRDTISVRPETPADHAQVRTVNELAFGQRTEADLVDKLRGDESVSLVADDNGVVGHILFTSVTIDHQGRRIVGMGLAPMAVHPDRQRQGIGSRLVTRGLEILRERRCPFVVVVGHPDYYPRFGFVRGSSHGLRCEFEGVGEDAFMVMILDPTAMTNVSGVTMYRQEFNETG